MNLRIGASQTVHNAAMFSHTKAGVVMVPSCNVATEGKARHETTDAVTCKSCQKYNARKAHR